MSGSGGKVVWCTLQGLWGCLWVLVSRCSPSPSTMPLAGRVRQSRAACLSGQWPATRGLSQGSGGAGRAPPWKCARSYTSPPPCPPAQLVDEKVYRAAQRTLRLHAPGISTRRAHLYVPVWALPNPIVTARCAQGGSGSGALKACSGRSNDVIDLAKNRKSEHSFAKAAGMRARARVCQTSVVSNSLVYPTATPDYVPLPKRTPDVNQRSPSTTQPHIQATHEHVLRRLVLVCSRTSPSLAPTPSTPKHRLYAYLSPPAARRRRRARWSTPAPQDMQGTRLTICCSTRPDAPVRSFCLARPPSLPPRFPR